MEKLLIEDIPIQYQDIAEFLGIDTFIEFCRYFGGSYIYVPNIKTFEAKIRDRDIIVMRNNGASIKSIAKKYNVTTNYVGKILKKYK
ncbi:MAG: hypothetical protein IJ086_14015 [Clostridium sp.]|nr:hypothetical protein [Clostridium sp.]MBQ9072688.1 hypothetical protein [Bacilli bacterium]